MRVGIVGLGVMGMPIAKNMLGHGLNVVTYARRREVAAEIGRLGAEIAKSPQNVAEMSDVFITVLPNGDVLDEILFNPETGAAQAIKRDGIVIDMGTTSPTQTREIAKKFSERSVNFLDAPVSGGAERAASGTLTVMAGGNYETFLKAHCIFEAIGSKLYYTGENSTAQTIKLINNMVACINIAALCEGVALAERIGVNSRVLIDVINSSSGQSYASGVKANNYILPKKFENGAKATIFHKDMSLALHMADEVDLGLSLASETKKYLEKLIASGMGNLDASATVLLLENE